MANSRVYALGLKDHIELRRSAKPPRVRVTKVVRKFPAREDIRIIRGGRYDYATGRPFLEDQPYHYHVPAHQSIIRVFDFIGGRYLKSIKRNRKKGFPKVPLGKVVELPPEKAAQLLG